MTNPQSSPETAAVRIVAPRPAGGNQQDGGYPSFLGSGWSFPPVFDPLHASVAMSDGVENIRESLYILLSTTIGERVMLATYGSNLQSYVFASLTTTIASEIVSGVKKAILDWEPRIDVLSVSVDEMDALDGFVQIVVDFAVRQTNIRSNLVYPFYLQGELTLPLPPR